MRTRNTWKTRELESALASKGFQPLDAAHTWYRLYHGGRRTHIRTKVSHGIPEYGRDLLKKMADQMHLTRRELDQFVECPLTRDGYLDLLERGGHL